MNRRKQNEICLNILNTCKEEINVTGLMHQANISWKQAKKYLAFLEKQDLIFTRYKKRRQQREHMIQTTVNGFLILKANRLFFQYFNNKQKLEEK